MASLYSPFSAAAFPCSSMDPFHGLQLSARHTPAQVVCALQQGHLLHWGLSLDCSAIPHPSHTGVLKGCFSHFFFFLCPHCIGSFSPFLKYICKMPLASLRYSVVAAWVLLSGTGTRQLLVSEVSAALLLPTPHLIHPMQSIYFQF